MNSSAWLTLIVCIPLLLASCTKTAEKVSDASGDVAVDAPGQPDTAVDSNGEEDTNDATADIAVPDVPASDSGVDVPSVPDASTDGPPPEDAGPTCDEEALSDLYSQYVEPFISGTVPQSCSQCHMTGIDMSMYAQDTPCDTMACMVQMGAVDLSNPEASSLLSQIQMGDPNSSVFDVSDEHAAMLEWITWSAQCNDQICGDIDSPCDTGTGAESTGINPIGDCSEDDLLAKFWDSVIVDRHRCVSCHSTSGLVKATGGPCTQDADCDDKKQCLDGFCRMPGPFYAPHYFEGSQDPLNWNKPAHKLLGLNTMYNMVALGLINEIEPLDSLILIKPLLEDFQPTAIYGPGVSIENIPDGVGKGVYHGGSSKFALGCKNGENCPASGVIDCRIGKACMNPGDCGPDETCTEDHFCRLTGSYCDMTYAHYVDFIEYYVECKTQ